MPFWNKYPFTDFHELNLDWIISKVGQIEKNLKETLEAMAKAITAQEKAEEAQGKAEEAQGKAEEAETNAETYYNNITTESGAIITNWLDDNISGESVSVVDKTLSVSGASADSQTVGYNIKSLFEDAIITPVIWYQGLWNTTNGITQNNSNWIRTELYPVKMFNQKFGWIAKSDAIFNTDVLFFSADKAYLGYKRGSERNWFNGLFNENTAYIAFNLHIVDNSGILPENAPEVKLLGVPNFNSCPAETIINSIPASDSITLNRWIEETYITGDFNIAHSSGFNLYNGIFTVEPNELYYCVNDTEDVRMVFFDADYNAIEITRIITNSSSQLPKESPVNAKFAMVFCTSTADSITINKLGLSDTCVEAPFVTSDKYIFIPNKLFNANGTYTTTDNYSSVIVKVKNGCTVYQSINRQTSGLLCVHGVVSAMEFTNYTPTGRAYDVTADGYAVCNIRTSDIDSVLNKCIEYLTINEETADKYCVIGDSLTWLDGRNNYGGSETMVGWQAQIRKQGHIVRNLGYSGHPYATITRDGETLGIAYSIIENSIILSGYNKFILFGGTNDVKDSLPIGNEPSDYTTPNTTTTTFTGAIGALVDYIRTQRPDAEIYIMNMIPSKLASRNYEKMTEYHEPIYYCHDYWSLRLIPSFSGIDVSPANTTTFNTYYYDDTHLNIKGMERLGKFVVSKLD